MPLPLIVPVIITIAVSASATAGGLCLYDRFTNTDLDQIVRAVKLSRSQDFAFLRQIYFENYPGHGDAEFRGFLDYFLAGVVCMRAEGELKYSDYETASHQAIQKVYDSYTLNKARPAWDLIYWSFKHLVQYTYESGAKDAFAGSGRQWLIDAESQGFIKTIRNAYQRNRNLAEKIKTDPEFKNEFSEFWYKENATYESAGRKFENEFENATGGFFNRGNMILLGLIGIGVVFICAKR